MCIRDRNQIWEGDVMSGWVAAGWHDTANFDANTSGILTAPNGEPVQAGFRHYLLTVSPAWSANNWPLRPEYPASPLEPGNPNWSGARLDCRGMEGPTSLGY